MPPEWLSFPDTQSRNLGSLLLSDAWLSAQVCVPGHRAPRAAAAHFLKKGEWRQGQIHCQEKAARGPQAQVGKETPIPPVPGGEEREQGSPSTGDFVPESHPAASQAPGLIKEDPERTGSWGQGEGRTRPGLLPRDSEPEWGLFRVLGDEWNLGKTGPAQGLWPFGVPCPGRRGGVELPETLESPPGCGSTSPPPTRGNSSPASELRTGGLEALFSQSISGLNNNNNCFFTFNLKTKRKQLLCLPTPPRCPTLPLRPGALWAAALSPGLVLQ